ncbi:MAG: UDP-4-amino-4,6-dideoxy-N-acetyl-beta-L-altrosamine transaminase [Bacteroidia bacterium]|nr:UDP-4-amino-4,6-dideoxy-N-acetyl-beta-L-altrosamine transaminase [Bacteroidia bacterium]
MSFKIPYGKQFISDDDTKAVIEALHSDFLTQGPRIAEFEKNFAAYIGCKYAVAVSNGTAALHLPLLAIDLKQGDNVITTPITFAASANAARYCGANVYFVDIDPDTYVMSVEALKILLEKHPKGFFKAVVPVDFTGFPVDLEKIRKLADEYGLFILEDACHSPGGYFTDSKGKKQMCGNGNYANAAAFSFHPVKHIASGEGGMITTNDETLYKKILKLRTHGITKENLQYDFPDPSQQGAWYYEMQDLGYNYRITDIQAALGNSQLKRADSGIARRQEIAKKYREAFKGAPIKIQKENKDAFNAYHLFVVEVENRKGLYEFLIQNGIFAQIHYVPVHLMPYYKQFGWKPGDFPNSEKYYKHCISLPMYPTLSNEEQNYVIEKVLKFVND